MKVTGTGPVSNSRSLDLQSDLLPTALWGLVGYDIWFNKVNIGIYTITSVVVVFFYCQLISRVLQLYGTSFNTTNKLADCFIKISGWGTGTNSFDHLLGRAVAQWWSAWLQTEGLRVRPSIACHCVVSLSKNINLASYWFNPGRSIPW